MSEHSTRTGRRTGRPPLDTADASVSIHLRVPAREFDRVWREARGARLSVPAYVREVLATRDRDPEEEPE